LRKSFRNQRPVVRQDQRDAKQLQLQEKGVMNSSAAVPDDSHALKCELAGEVLRSFGRLRLQVTGWSMLPTIWPGDTLVIDRIPSEAVFAGDIVLFGRDQRLFAHRVVTMGFVSRAVAGKSRPQDAGILTRGDAMRAVDRPVSESDLLGRISFILRNGKRVKPSRRPRFSERALAAVLRRSTFAARVAVGVHDLLHASQSQSREQTSQVKTQSL
jgi:Peptidase S24-like